MAFARENNGGDTLRLDDVEFMAEQEYCEILFTPKSKCSKPASFLKFDTVINGYVRINVFCDSSTVGIELPHPRQGKMHVILHKVSKTRLREIFRSPRECAGYPDLRKTEQPGVGDVVQVNGYGDHGCAKIIGVRDHLSGIVKVRGQ